MTDPTHDAVLLFSKTWGALYLLAIQVDVLVGNIQKRGDFSGVKLFNPKQVFLAKTHGASVMWL